MGKGRGQGGRQLHHVSFIFAFESTPSSSLSQILFRIHLIAPHCTASGTAYCPSPLVFRFEFDPSASMTRKRSRSFLTDVRFLTKARNFRRWLPVLWQRFRGDSGSSGSQIPAKAQRMFSSPLLFPAGASKLKRARSGTAFRAVRFALNNTQSLS